MTVPSDLFEKGTDRWQTRKFKGKNLIRTAVGSTCDQAMIHVTVDETETHER
jgi:hypothetical protein